jgi:cystathionine gamma-synthase
LSLLNFADLERFFIHLQIQAFTAAIVEKYGRSGEAAMLFPTHATASRCRNFFVRLAPEVEVRVVDLIPSAEKERTEELDVISPKVSAVLFPQDLFSIAKQFWQHSGDGVSSRRAEYCHHLFRKGLLIEAASLNQPSRVCKGPRRYQKKTSIDLNNLDGATNGEVQDPTQFVEERFGRNLNLSKAKNAKLAIRRRIAGSLTADVDLTEALSLNKDNAKTRHVAGFSEDDVYLYPTGMSSIFNSHRNLLRAKGPLKAIVYG